MEHDVKKAAPVDARFVRAKGLQYLDFLQKLHQRTKPEWYLEIGTNRGRSLSFVTCASVAIDPRFKLEEPAQGKKPLLLLLQETSDAGFASDTLRRLDPRFDIAFLDGMHKFEYLLRDLINAEKLMAKGGLVFMHDTSPLRSAMTGREPMRDGGWTGDVWKMLPILAEFRPDLKVDHLDCRATGLCMVRGAWGQSDALERNYDAILARYIDMTIDEFGVETYFAAHPHVSSVAFLDSL